MFEQFKIPIIVTLIVTILVFAIIMLIERNWKLALAVSSMLVFAVAAIFFVSAKNQVVAKNQSNKPTTLTVIDNTGRDISVSENRLTTDDIKNYNEIVALLEKRQVKVYSTENTEHLEGGVIFIGDSRFNGMNIYCKVDSNNNQFLVAKDGASYNWFISDCISQVNTIVADNPEIDNWTLVSGFGVNDLQNIDNYLASYEELSKYFDIVLVSVNPIEYHSYLTNSDVQAFNKKLRDSKFKYINTYDMLIRDGYTTVDGLHYDKETYTAIYNHICKLLKI